MTENALFRGFFAVCSMPGVFGRTGYVRFHWSPFNGCLTVVLSFRRRGLPRKCAYVLYCHIKFLLTVHVFGSCFWTLAVILVSDVLFPMRFHNHFLVNFPGQWWTITVAVHWHITSQRSCSVTWQNVGDSTTHCKCLLHREQKETHRQHNGLISSFGLNMALAVANKG